MKITDTIIYKTTPADREDMLANNFPIRDTLAGIVTFVNPDGKINALIFPDADAPVFYRPNLIMGPGEGQYQVL